VRAARGVPFRACLRAAVLAGTCAALLAGWLSSVAIGTAHAAPDVAPTQPAALRPSVAVVFNGPVEDAQALSESLRELLHRLGLELELTDVDQFAPTEPWPAVPPEVVVRVWIDGRQPDAALITLSDRRSGRTGLTRLVPRRGSRGLLLEETALVVHAETESLLSEPAPAPSATSAAPSPVAPQPEPSVAPAHETAPSGPTPWQVDAMTFAEGQALAADSGLVFGAGAGARAHLGRSAWVPGLWLLGAYHAPFGQKNLPVQLNVSVWSARLLPTLRTAGQHRFALEFGLGGGVDWFLVSPGVTAEGVSQLDANRTDLSPIAESLLALHVAVSQTTRLVLATTLDWDLHPRSYFAEGATRDVLIRTHQFRPGLTIGVSFDIAQSAEAP
jgi:hypothetical protein